MIVVTAIFVLLSAVVLANNSRFGNTVILENLAHDIALSVREAQVYGIAVRRCDPAVTTACTTNNAFANGYGMHFAPGTTYELFADVNANGKWEANETVRQTNITGGFTISTLCSPEGDCGKSRIDILFKRPEPDACISVSGAVSLNSDGHCLASAPQRAIITVASPHGMEANITIESSGQISVR